MAQQKRDKLADDVLQEQLKAIPDWRYDGSKLHRDFKFENFIDAFGFMTKIAFVAERINHHPEWSNVYNQVSMSLMTHDTNGISMLDIELARVADRFFGAS